jgi:hypothetical protein
MLKKSEAAKENMRGWRLLPVAGSVAALYNSLRHSHRYDRLDP